MDEREQRKLRQLRKRRRRRRKRILYGLISVLMVLVLAVVLVIALRTINERNRMTNVGDIEVLTGEAVVVSEAASAGQEAGGTVSEDIPIPQVETITLSEAQKHTGDLILVNKDRAYDFAANESILGLVNIKDTQTYEYPVDKEEFMLSRHIMESLDEMIHACDATMETRVTAISSAYRTKEYQQGVWDDAESEYGEEYAKKYVAIPGYSEHHTGLALDLGIIYDDGSYGAFSESLNAKWMEKNCWRFGFIRRYTEEKVRITGISNEAWHFRYVGFPHAAYMTEHDLCLEEYLDELERTTSTEHPLETEVNGQKYLVYFTDDPVITKPDSYYEVSGNNKNGWIVTVFE